MYFLFFLVSLSSFQFSYRNNISLEQQSQIYATQREPYSAKTIKLVVCSPMVNMDAALLQLLTVVPLLISAVRPDSDVGTTVVSEWICRELHKLPRIKVSIILLVGTLSL
ncbi:hypothetical protein ANCCAN_21622 [Ancylostoma caninum]|uniref:Uncharacterized protein n=1 Tax=Ancylostoma caninum TaxID=29170 RepID=A0A368FM03_ANCCA|nr:hypothetical protein ANCCAN_21622 [Ancylostoma caninum]